MCSIEGGSEKNGENNINNWVAVALYAKKKKTIAKHLNYLLLIKRIKKTAHKTYSIAQEV